MSDPVPFESADDEAERRCRPRPFRVWLLCAVPWLTAVSALFVYDHHRAIVRSVESYFAERGPETLALVTQWLIAAAKYCGRAIGFYGVLPAALTFVLFVLFLPWAVRWAGDESLED
jgi:hypothetical protein